MENEVQHNGGPSTGPEDKETLHVVLVGPKKVLGIGTILLSGIMVTGAAFHTYRGPGTAALGVAGPLLCAAIRHSKRMEFRDVIE